MIKFVINGEPVAQDRCRFFIRNKKMMIYNPQSKLKKELQKIIKSDFENNGYQTLEHTTVSFLFYMPVLKSMNKRDHQIASEEKLKHEKKPDIDNLVKFYLDVISGIVIPDDNIAQLGCCMKLYSDNPRTEIYLQNSKGIFDDHELYSIFGECMSNGQLIDDLFYANSQYYSSCVSPSIREYSVKVGIIKVIDEIILKLNKSEPCFYVRWFNGMTQVIDFNGKYTLCDGMRNVSKPDKEELRKMHSEIYASELENVNLNIICEKDGNKRHFFYSAAKILEMVTYHLNFPDNAESFYSKYLKAWCD